MDESNRTLDRTVPADWRPGDCDPELTELFRRAFPDDEAVRLLREHASRVSLPTTDAPLNA